MGKLGSKQIKAVWNKSQMESSSLSKMNLKKKTKIHFFPLCLMMDRDKPGGNELENYSASGQPLIKSREGHSLLSALPLNKKRKASDMQEWTSVPEVLVV